MAMHSFPEFATIEAMADLLEPLSYGERERVLTWLSQYFLEDQLESALDAVLDPTPEVTPQVEEEPEAEEEPLDDFASFYAAVAPKTAWQRAATSGYWLETREGQSAWKTSAMTKLLRSIDVDTKSLSMTVGTYAKSDNPVFTVMSKSGDSMQARKTFQLADAGYAFVEDRL